MGLAFLADDERIERPPFGCRGVQHRDRDGIGAQREPADGVRLDVVLPQQVEHHSADERGRPVVEGDPAQVDVVVGLAPAGERDRAVDDGQLGDQHEQSLALGRGRGLARVRHGWRCYRRRRGRLPLSARTRGWVRLSSPRQRLCSAGSAR